MVFEPWQDVAPDFPRSEMAIVELECEFQMNPLDISRQDYCALSKSHRVKLLECKSCARVSGLKTRTFYRNSVSIAVSLVGYRD